MKSSPHRPVATTRLLVLPCACLCIAFGAGAGAQETEQEKQPEDLLRFLNGDSLHGRFLGLKDEELRWEHGEAREPMALKTVKLRRVAFNGGRASKILRSQSYVLIQDGDRVPGTITKLDAETLTIETDFAGTIKIPRGSISQIAPNPHGGAVHYIGPFAADDWTIVEPPRDEEEVEEEEEGKEDPQLKKEDPAEENGEEEKEEPPWVFSGGAYYSNGQLPIAVDTKAPDKARMRFTLAWRNRLNTAIAFHATLERPPKPEAKDDEEKAEKEGAEEEKIALRRLAIRDNSNARFALTYGRSYVLTIYSNYAQLYRCGFNESGEPEMDRLATSSSNLRLEESGEAEFELRCDREDATITLFADGRYISQWKDALGYAGTGSHLAFACQSSSSRLRVSDVVVSSWNGMIDSAQSMEVDDRDIILLANGTDRFSGEVLSLEGGKFRIKGTYAELVIPQEDVQEIRTARYRRTEKDPEESSRATVRLLFQPFGRISLQPREASATRLRGRHPALGDLTLDLGFSSLMEFSFGHSVLDSWDDDY